MKQFVVVLLALVAVTAAQFSQQKPFQSFGSQRNPSRSFGLPPNVPRPQQPSRAFVPAPAVSRVSVQDDRSASTLRLENSIKPDGGSYYAFETDNGISAQQQGSLKNLGGNPPVVANVVQGSYSYTSPDGVPVVVSYTADENGYQATGDVLPTPPPIPELIARSLEYLRSLNVK